ncbi:MAG: YbaK/EbsC family protein [Thermoleophilia bacterium]|nr:YbaK/EbsC family protein [Thermoleophilia bacterium]
MRSCSDVRDHLIQKGISHEIVHLPSSSSTALLAADALGVPVGEVVKSLVFLLDDERPLLALVPGDTTVDTDALARDRHVSQVALAKGEQVLELTGYRPGAVPPCALETDVPVIADPRVFVPDVVYCGAGTTTTMLKIRSADLEALIKPRKLPIAQRR